MAEETDTDDDIPFKCETLLRLKELFFEASAAAKSNDFILFKAGLGSKTA